MTFRYSSLFDNFRDDCVAATFEFVGTAFFLLFGLGGIQAAAADSTTAGRQSSGVEQTLYIATSMGMSLLVSAWLFFRVTGGLFNPNVSLALLLVGSMGPVRFVLYCIAQLAGAIAASAIVWSLTSAPLSVKYVKPTVLNLQPLNVHTCVPSVPSCNRVRIVHKAFSSKCSSRQPSSYPSLCWPQKSTRLPHSLL